ncbi:MAG: CYTH domain-containing protein [Methanobacteriota archaeon]
MRERSGEAILELNDVKGLGAFVDFEITSDDASTKKKIVETIKSLGYSENDIEPRLYS